jgi:Tol biopolymer transport system component
VQELDAIDAKPLPGTDDAGWPFWSPDGLAIAFFAARELRTMTVAGGTPHTVARFPEEVTTAGGETAGGTWGSDGDIVFAPSPKSRLYRVAAAGGTPVPVTKLEAGDVGHVRPQYLPDGRRFQYLVLAERPERRGIHLGSVDSLESRLVLPTIVKATYVPPGYLLYVRDGRLKARAFDESTGNWASADELPLADSVDHITTDGRAAFDASAAGTLVYRESGLMSAVQPTVVDARGATLARIGEPGDYQTLALLPSGTQLAAERHDLRTATGDLWLIDIETGATRPLTADGMHHNAAVWSPTGTELVFTGRPGGVRNLHLMDVASGVHEPLLPWGPDRNPTDWSRDARHILYEESSAATQFDLWAFDVPARRPIPLLREAFNERDARLSPDGRYMAYVSDRSGRPEVYVRPFLDRAEGPEAQVSVTGGFAPRWSRDTARLYFYALDGAVVAVGVDTAGRFSAERPQQLFAADMRFTCARDAALRCPSPPVTWEVLDGERFLINPAPAGPSAPRPPIRVIENWTSLLEPAAPPSP